MREATGIGYSTRMGAPVAWLCEDCKLTDLGRVVYHMSARDLTFHEARALVEAGDKAGEYLESIGKTDLASLSETEWLKFLKTVFEQYAQTMRDRLLNHVAPF